MRPAAHPLSLARLATPWLAVIGGALLSGALATGQADLWLGKRAALLLLAAIVGGTFLVVFSFLGASAILIWEIEGCSGRLTMTVCWRRAKPLARRRLPLRR